MSELIDLMLAESELEDDVTLRRLLDELEREATAVRPMPSAALSELMRPRRTGPSHSVARPTRRRSVAGRGALITSIVVIGAIGLGAGAAAASPDARSAIGAGVAVIAHLFEPATANAPKPTEGATEVPGTAASPEPSTPATPAALRQPSTLRPGPTTRRVPRGRPRGPAPTARIPRAKILVGFGFELRFGFSGRGSADDSSKGSGKTRARTRARTRASRPATARAIRAATATARARATEGRRRRSSAALVSETRLQAGCRHRLTARRPR